MPLFFKSVTHGRKLCQMCMMCVQMLSGHFGAPVAELNNGNNNGIITAGRCDYFNHDQSSHLDGEGWISTQKLFPWGNWCGCLSLHKRNQGLEDIKLLQLERRKHIWLAWEFLYVPGGDLYKSRKWFNDRKWGAKQVGRRYRRVWRWEGVIHQPVYRRHGHLINQHSCIIMAFLNIWQSVTQTLCVHN